LDAELSGDWAGEPFGRLDPAKESVADGMARDEAVVAGARQALGPDMELMVVRFTPPLLPR